ncbi:nuclear transport factor 2 family protein [Engelhardtia mirabilis]|uniref:SnoaL-like domain-containing protein n=1 Tax=Engelhardtia mirabilis TaxID=2528011 RepID=A0A518BG93_9BACT|nr:hypothetical protein Pla133_10090 [Planctomycetes bacterium Pla133]QDV00269.1 hypothetical protein Pla86_10080 [Planctomycetes bacterium Pla86]
MSRPTPIIAVLFVVTLLAAVLAVISTASAFSGREAPAEGRDPVAPPGPPAQESGDDRDSASADLAAIGAVLDDFHAAAAAADFERYFGHLAPGALFVGTDAAEVWTVEEFQAYAKPHFDAGRGWTYAAQNRHVDPIGGDGAAFYEDLVSAKYGHLRGSGALVRIDGEWRIVHYVMSFAVPNELAPELVERTARLAAEGEAGSDGAGDRGAGGGE